MRRGLTPLMIPACSPVRNVKYRTIPARHATLVVDLGRIAPLSDHAPVCHRDARSSTA